MLMIYYIEIMLQIRRKETKYLSSFSLGKKMDFSSFLTEMVRGNLFMKPIHFTASLSHNKPKKKKKKERHSTTFPAPQPGGTFTNLLAVDGDRKKKLENRDIKKACPYQGFFTKVLHKQVYSVLNTGIIQKYHWYLWLHSSGSWRSHAKSKLQFSKYCTCTHEQMLLT